MLVHESFTSGPIPSASELAAYGAVLHDAPDRILAMAERQSAHRQGLEKHVVRSNVIKEYLGMAMGFILALVAMGTGAWLIHEGQDIAGWVALFAPLAGLVIMFVRRQSTQREAVAEKKRRR